MPNIDTPIWPIEGVALESVDPAVEGSLAAIVLSIDGGAVDGLTGTANSLAYRVAEIERHLHSGGRWFELASAATGTHKADRIGSGAGPFQIDAGNDTWGSWVQILGSDDTPVKSGRVYFDPHQLIVEDTERASTYFIQIGRGASGAEALTNDTYTETIYSATVQKDTGVIMLQTGRAPAGSLLWARCMCPGQDTGTLDFYYGVHEYEG